LKKHKPWSDERKFRVSRSKGQAKMQCLQDPNLRNVDKLNNVRREGSGHCRNKKKEYLKAKIDEFKLTLRPRISETYTVASMTLRRVTSLVLI
jgi:hypothetical protein